MKRILALVLSALLVLISVPAMAEEARDVITIGKEMDTSGLSLLEGQTADSNNYYLNYAEQYANCEVSYEWFLADDSQKISLAVASDKMPDAMIVDQNTYNMLLEANVLMDLTDVYAAVAPGTVLETAYTTFTAAFESAHVGDKLMALPNTMQQNVHAITWIRKDWLDNLGLEVPSTLEELAEVAAAFVANDPDGNGENDTIGIPVYEKVFGTYNQNGDLSYIASQFGAYPRQWYTDANGNVVYGSVTEETHNALVYLSEMYEAGVIDPEYAVRDFKELVVSGKCGIMTGNWSAAAGPIQQSHAFDGADWIPLLCPVTEDGQYLTMYRQPTTEYVVVNKECKNPEAVLKLIVGAYNFHWYIDLDEEWTSNRVKYEEIGASWMLMPLAIQLEKSLVVKERYDAFEQYINTGSTEGLSTAVLGFLSAYDAYKADSSSLTGWSWYKGMYLGGAVSLSENNEYLTPCFFGTTESMKDCWTTLQTMEDEIFVKIIMGEAEIDEFDTFVENWYALGGADVLSEVQEFVDAH